MSVSDYLVNKMLQKNIVVDVIEINIYGLNIVILLFYPMISKDKIKLKK